MSKYESDAKAREYVHMAYVDRFAKPFYELMGLYVEGLVKMVNVSNHCMVEVGYGSGKILGDFAVGHSDWKCLGLEYSGAMKAVTDALLITGEGIPDLNLSGKKLTNVELKDGVDVQDLKQWYGSADLVVCVNVLDRVVDPGRGLAELMNLITPFGGMLIVSAFDYEQLTPESKRLSLLETAKRISGPGRMVNVVQTQLTKELPNGGLKCYEETVFLAWPKSES